MIHGNPQVLRRSSRVPEDTDVYLQALEQGEQRGPFKPHVVSALGYIALLGSGITVVDLNRFYDLPTPPESAGIPGWGQCGRRAGAYEGEEIDFHPEDASPETQLCNLPDSYNIGMTMAVAVQGGETGSSAIHVYSPLNRVGALHTMSPGNKAGKLRSDQNHPFTCF
ncbi:MAG: hypothetical protein GY867_07825, partial [bacterium]|nr:hypothetical protein [bacterium]